MTNGLRFHTFTWEATAEHPTGPPADARCAVCGFTYAEHTSPAESPPFERADVEDDDRCPFCTEGSPCDDHEDGRWEPAQTARQRILAEVEAIAKWRAEDGGGSVRHDAGRSEVDWIRLIAPELLNVIREFAVWDSFTDEARRALLQAAVLTVAAIEEFDRRRATMTRHTTEGASVRTAHDVANASFDLPSGRVGYGGLITRRLPDAHPDEAPSVPPRAPDEPATSDG